MHAGGQTYEMVKANDAVIHRFTSRWNTPTPDERLGLVMEFVNMLLETERND